MNPEYERKLETELDRVLKRLPELRAPRGLSPRVMAAIAVRQPLPWYRQPLPAWPLALRFAALVILFASFGALCLATFQLTRAAGFTNAMQELGETFSFLGSVWSVINILLGAVVLVIKHLGTGFMVGFCLAAALGYAVCIGLGTACIRLAYAKR